MDNKNFNDELLKRLTGYPLGIIDRSGKKELLVGEIVRVYYTFYEKEVNDKLFVIGKIKYDFLHKKFFIRLNEEIHNFNDNNRNLILDIKSGEINKIIAYEDNYKIINDYKSLTQILNSKNYITFYNKIMDLFYDNRIQLFENEIKHIKNILNGIVDCNIDLTINLSNFNKNKIHYILNNSQLLINDIENVFKNYSSHFKFNDIDVIVKDNVKELLCLKMPINN